jgi:hypothetical protein
MVEDVGNELCISGTTCCVFLADQLMDEDRWAKDLGAEASKPSLSCSQSLLCPPEL